MKDVFWFNELETFPHYIFFNPVEFFASSANSAVKVTFLRRQSLVCDASEIRWLFEEDFPERSSKVSIENRVDNWIDGRIAVP